jgi:hypothetical protein
MDQALRMRADPYLRHPLLPTLRELRRNRVMAIGSRSYTCLHPVSFCGRFR